MIDYLHSTIHNIIYNTSGRVLLLGRNVSRWTLNLSGDSFLFALNRFYLCMLLRLNSMPSGMLLPPNLNLMPLLLLINLSHKRSVLRGLPFMGQCGLLLVCNQPECLIHLFI